jgi:hypothetical protein
MTENDQPTPQTFDSAPQTGELPAASPKKGALACIVGIAATLAAAAFTVSLAVRLIDCPDVGYHLAYGENFLDTGRIVQTNQFIYTKMDKSILADPANIGPGCWFDPDTGAYHFVNANWLSQVVMAWVHRAGGMSALSLLQAGLWAGIVALVIVTLRRNGVGWEWAGLPVLLIGFASFIRMPLRPEVFGYFLLAAQWCLLSGKKFSPWAALGVVLLQVPAANCHSYFLLAIALTGVMWLDSFLPWAWAKIRKPSEGEETASPAAMPARAKWLGVALIGVTAASLLNPWFIRGTLMPVETVQFLRANHVIGNREVAAGQIHPWALIKEFKETLPKDAFSTRDTLAFMAVLVMTGLAFVAALRRRQWGLALVMAVMVMVGFQMRRNIAPAAIILAPLSIIVLTQAWPDIQKLLRKIAPRLEWRGGLLVPLVILAAGIYFTRTVADNRYYLATEGTGRFGIGENKFMLPLDPAAWINENNPPGNVFTDYDSSSDLMYFTRPRREMPLLTNTWAYPPYMMLQQALFVAGLKPYDAFMGENNVQTVVLESAGSSQASLVPMAQKLVKDSDWVIAQVCPRYLIFLKRFGASEDLARRQGKTEANFDVEDFIRRCIASDTVPRYALNRGAMTLTQIGWLDAAMKVWQKSLEIAPDNAEGLFGRAVCLLTMSEKEQAAMKSAVSTKDEVAANKARARMLELWSRARGDLEQAVRVDPSHTRARAMLQRLSQVMPQNP